MFSGKQFGILGGIAGANLLLSLLVSTVGGSLGAQGPTGQTGPQGPQGSTGETGADGTPVEFSVENGVLVWRYVGETEWNELDLEISGGGGGTINTGDGQSYFTNWMFGTNPSFNFDYRSRVIVDNSATYAANLINNEGYTGVASLADLQAIDDSPEALLGKYVLTADIDLSAWTPDFGTRDFNVINGDFRGVLDGAGYDISNFTVDAVVDGGQVYQAGLFERLASATVENLTLLDFNILASGQIYNSGALSAETTSYDDEPVLIDQVRAENITFSSTSNSIDRVGGLIGEIESDVSFIRTQVSNIEATNDSSMYAVGGLYGYMEENYTLELYEVAAQMTVSEITDGQQRSVDRIGAVGGNNQNNATILAYQVTSNLTGGVEEHSSAFIGNVAGYSKVILKDVDVTADITSSYPESGSKVGGVFGFYGRDGVLFMDDVNVTGNIEANYEVGGFIGHGKEGSTIKISNSTSTVDIFADEQVGGFVGRLEEYRHKWMFDNVDFTGTITLKESVNSTSHQGGYFAGIVAVVDDTDSSDAVDTNQVWIKDSTVDLEVVYEVTEPESTEEAYYEIWNVGGFISEVNDDNEIRITNSSALVDVNFTKSNFTKLTYFTFNLNEVGGAIGYSEESNVLLLNVETELNVDVTVDDFAPEADGNFYLDMNVRDLGGAVGELDSGQLTIVAGSYELNVSSTLKDIASTKHDYDFYLEQIGGLIGLLDDDGLLLAEETSVALTVSYTVENVTIDANESFDSYIREIGAFIGDASGIAVINDTERTITVTGTLPEAADNIVISLGDFTKDLGTVNPFVFINN